MLIFTKLTVAYVSSLMKECSHCGANVHVRKLDVLVVCFIKARVYQLHAEGSHLSAYASLFLNQPAIHCIFRNCSPLGYYSTPPELLLLLLLFRYEEQVREKRNAIQKEDLSDMVAEHAAKQKVRVVCLFRRETQCLGGTSTSTCGS